MSPTLRTALGLKGHRPVVGHLDGQDLVDVFGALQRITGRLTTRMVERGHAPGPRVQRPSRPRHMQAAFARHVRELGRAYPAARDPHVVPVIDHAPWHHGGLITKALDQLPQLQWYRLPSSSPQLQIIERFWLVLGRRATHKRLFPTHAQLKQALRHSLCYDQPLKHRVRSVIQAPKKRTQLSAP
jgi:hypothetical protein